MRKHSSLRFTRAAIVTTTVLLAVALAGVLNRHAVPDAEAELRDTRVVASTTERMGSVSRAASRYDADISALERFKPGYTFWRHVFTIPDGSVVFGSATDGRRLDVIRRASMDRRESIASELASEIAGPVLHNETRGTFALPGLRAYAPLLAEWGAIYERFGVPRAIGLAQAMIESGFIGRRESEADAVGLCQFLRKNWTRLDAIDPAVIEIHNQTTQAAYCAAYLTVLATKYDSFIPALSEHHAGGTNIGRVLVNGERLGGDSPREQYFKGSELALALRTVSAKGGYKDIYGSYGPRSYRYAEMIFGNAGTIEDAIAEATPRRVFAMRTDRNIPIGEVVRRTGLSEEKVKYYNPALVKQVPAGATLYLPTYDPAFGRDVTFWHRPAPSGFAALLDEFLSIAVPPVEWETRAFAATLHDFERRFRATGSEEGSVMATILTYTRGESIGARASILATYRASHAIRGLFERGVRETELPGE